MLAGQARRTSTTTYASAGKANRIDCAVHACRTSKEDQYYGIRVCVGGSSLDWFETEPCLSTSGVAWQDSFGKINSDNPAAVQRDIFAFSE
jgi:hypothetical protein